MLKNNTSNIVIFNGFLYDFRGSKFLVLHTVMIRFSAQVHVYFSYLEGGRFFRIECLFGTRRLFLFRETTECSKQTFYNYVTRNSNKYTVNVDELICLTSIASVSLASIIKLACAAFSTSDSVIPSKRYLVPELLMVF